MRVAVTSYVDRGVIFPLCYIHLAVTSEVKVATLFVFHFNFGQNKCIGLIFLDSPSAVDFPFSQAAQQSTAGEEVVKVQTVHVQR